MVVTSWPLSFSIQLMNHFSHKKLSILLTVTTHLIWYLQTTRYFKIVKNFNKVTWIKDPSPAASLSSQGPASNIRGHSHRIRRQEVTNFTPREDFLSNQVVSDWNALSALVIESASINLFKNRLDKHFENSNSLYSY